MEFEVLKTNLNSEDPWVQKAAISEIVESKNLETIDQLIEKLKNKKVSVSVRGAVVDALGKLGKLIENKGKIVNELKKVISLEEDISLRTAAITALGELRDWGAIDDLIGILKNEQSSLRQAAAIALGKYGQLDNIKDTIKSEIAEALISAMREDDSFVREAAATGLSSLGDDGLKQIVPALRNLKSLEWRQRTDAVTELGKCKNDRIIKVIEEFLLNDVSVSVRKAAAAALEVQREKKTENSLIKALGDKDDRSVREAAAKALESLGNKAGKVFVAALDGDEVAQNAVVNEYFNQLIEPLVLVQKVKDLQEKARNILIRVGKKIVKNLVFLGAEDEALRDASISIIEGIGTDACKDLRNLLREPQNSFVRLIATIALGKLRDKGAANLLFQKLNEDPSSRVREAAFVALCEIGDRQIVSNLIKLIGSEYAKPEMKKAAAKAFARFKNDKMMMEHLLNLLNDKDSSVRDVAETAIKEFGDNAAEFLIPKLHDLIYDAKLTNDKVQILNDKFETAKLLDKVQPLTVQLEKAALERAKLLDKVKTLDDHIEKAKLLDKVKILDDQIEKAKLLDKTKILDDQIEKSKLEKEKILDKVKTLDDQLKKAESEKAKLLKKVKTLDDQIEKAKLLDKVKILDGQIEKEKLEKAKLETPKLLDEVKTLDNQLKEAEFEKAKLLAKVKTFDDQIEKIKPEKTELEKEIINNSSLRKTIVDLMATLKANKAIDILIDTLKDKEVYLRIAAVRALGEIGDSKAVAPLFETLEGVKNEREIIVREKIRETVLEALSKIDIIKDGPSFKMREDKTTQMRIDTISALGRIRDFRALDSLIAILKQDEDLDVRIAAAAALGDIGDTRAIEYLDQVQKERITFTSRILSPKISKKIGFLKAIAETAKEKIRMKQLNSHEMILN